MNSALIVVDMQNDFVDDRNGLLSVPGAAGITPLIDLMSLKYDIVVLTQDWHAANDPSFKEWPVHCLAGSWGAEISGLVDTAYRRASLIFRKSVNNAFSDANPGLAGYLRARNVTVLHVCGVATEYCVLETALGALPYGFRVQVPSKAVAGMGNMHQTFSRLRDAYVEVL